MNKHIEILSDNSLAECTGTGAGIGKSGFPFFLLIGKGSFFFFPVVFFFFSPFVLFGGSSCGLKAPLGVL